MPTGRVLSDEARQVDVIAQHLLATCRLVYRFTQLLDRPADLFTHNHGWRRNQQMVSRDSVDAPLHGINHQPPFRRRLSHEPGKVQVWRKWFLARLVSHKLNSPKQPDASYVPDCFAFPQSLERNLK